MFLQPQSTVSTFIMTVLPEIRNMQAEFQALDTSREQDTDPCPPPTQKLTHPSGEDDTQGIKA